eukprot:5094485-Heterocapsa_arctica.AAC.1
MIPTAKFQAAQSTGSSNKDQAQKEAAGVRSSMTPQIPGPPPPAQVNPSRSNARASHTPTNRGTATAAPAQQVKGRQDSSPPPPLHRSKASRA